MLEATTPYHYCAVFFFTALGLAACTSDNEAVPPPSSVSSPSEVPREASRESQAPAREVVAESLAYAEVDDNVVYGHFAIPVDMIEPLPAVIVVHDRWGLNDALRALCERLAGQGYIVLGIDVFQGQTATSVEDARTLEIAAIEQPELVLDNLQQAADFVLDVANAPDIALLGYGFGGSWALNAAVDRGERLGAAAFYYGQVSDDKEWLAGLDVPILGFFAQNDRAVPASSVEAFEATLGELAKEHDILLFADARRGFADELSDNYDRALAEESWVRLLDFLAATLNPPPTN